MPSHPVSTLRDQARREYEDQLQGINFRFYKKQRSFRALVEINPLPVNIRGIRNEIGQGRLILVPEQVS